MFDKQPIVSLQISSFFCQFELKVNDVPVASHKENLPVEVNIPINHWLKPGKNNLTLTQDIENSATLLSDSGCTVSLHIKPNGTERSTAITITNLELSQGANTSEAESTLDAIKFEASSTGQVISEKSSFAQSENKLSVHRTISLPLTLPVWNWFSGDVITDTEKTRNALYNQYQALHQLLEKKDFAALGNVMKERLGEMAAAFYKTPSEMAALSGIQTAAFDDEMELFPLDSDFEFEIMGDGKLARITRWNGDAQIVFIYKDESASQYFDFIFRKQAGKWILAR